MEAIAKMVKTVDMAVKLGLLPEEYEQIVTVLSRIPNFTELCIFSVMWSEHCCYKNSIKLLKTLPRKGKNILAEAGQENAGLVDIGDGLACAFKIESHNHPSAIEPYQGAATGVGGINRDIFTMGARPIAQLNSLRFGDISRAKTKWHLKGVVKGIGNYGNAFGIPVVGGEVYFDECYNTNPLVNAMSAGIVKHKQILSAISFGVGNPVFLVGSSTGKDGIHGASFASKDITDESARDLPSVQVGDPFQEKLLMEATIELAKTGVVIGMQDMGAAGIACSTSEMSAKGKHGMKIWLDKVPARQSGMEPFEILLSESQERMLAIIKKGKEKEALDIFKKWDLNCVQIGEVTKGGMLEYFMRGDKIAEIPAESLVLGGGAPVYERESEEPEYLEKIGKFSIDHIKEPENLKDVALFLAAHPNICSRKWVIRQYDTMVGTVNMNTNFPSDAGIVNLKKSQKALAFTVDCNSRYVHADPETGAAIAVAEAARNIVCSGGEPMAITNCLNFGNPYNPEVFWQFAGTINGIKKACETFNTPVTGGNVSFYNQTVKNDQEIPVHPTPVIGMLGIVSDKKNITPLAFRKKGDVIYLLGEIVDDISCSEYLYSFHKVKLSPAPHFNLEKEYKLHLTIRKLIRKGLLSSAHDCSEGGLFITLLEKAMHNNLGFDIITVSEVRTDSFLFGESQGRVVVSVDPEKETPFIDLMNITNRSFTLLGHVTKGRITIDDEEWGNIESWKKTYEGALEEMVQEVVNMNKLA